MESDTVAWVYFVSKHDATSDEQRQESARRYHNLDPASGRGKGNHLPSVVVAPGWNQS